MSFEIQEMIYTAYQALLGKLIYITVFSLLTIVVAVLGTIKGIKYLIANRYEILGTNYETFELIQTARIIEVFHNIKLWWSVPLFFDFSIREGN